MKILTPGHRYELANFENPDQPGQIIQFIEKQPAEPGSAQLVTISDGTTNEELIMVLIDRMQHLYNKFPSDETQCSIHHLKSALYAQQARTLSRMQRGVEGKHIK